METIIIESSDSITFQEIKDFLNGLSVEYKTQKKEKEYNPAFVKKILERSESAKKGNNIEIDPNDLWGSLGLSIDYQA
jgi:hypothetical protein